MSAGYRAEERTIYQIKVKGMLDRRWSDWFNELTIEIESVDPPVTTLTGPVIDQARLRGIISRLWDLNLTVISVTSNAEGCDPGHTHK
jgi:hypothetical protein